jgi:hypothetical protein
VALSSSLPPPHAERVPSCRRTARRVRAHAPVARMARTKRRSAEALPASPRNACCGCANAARTRGTLRRPHTACARACVLAKGGAAAVRSRASSAHAPSPNPRRPFLRPLCARRQPLSRPASRAALRAAADQEQRGLRAHSVPCAPARPAARCSRWCRRRPLAPLARTAAPAPPATRSASGCVRGACRVRVPDAGAVARAAR